MKVSDKRKAELTAWVDKVWVLHWRNLTPKSNSKSVFRKYVFRDNKTDEELKRIELSIIAQKKYWYQQNKIERVFGIPCLSAWYNQERYDDEFIEESSVDMKDREQLKACSHDNCSDEVHGSMFSKCSFHLNSKDSRLKQAFIKTGLDMKSPTFVEDCKNLCRKGMNFMTSREAI